MKVEQKPEEASHRLEALDREWDIDRTVEAEAATMGLLGLVLRRDFDDLPAKDPGAAKRVRAALAAVDN